MTALFPCGSVTGAPKIRTMEIIRELEPFPRRIYTGTIGLLKPGGDCLFNVAIRTVLLDSQTGEATFNVGSGITFSSTSAREYEECLLKSAFLSDEAEEFRLLESIRLEAAECFLIKEHLARLRSSAEQFGFVCPRERIESALSELAKEYSGGAWKVRLLLSRDGGFAAEALPLSDGPCPVRIGLAQSPVNSNDRFLFHKTTRRQSYEYEVEARPDCDDVVFWNERGEITESSIANVLVENDGQFWTPPLTSGLLAGVFRNHLLRKGEIRERVIKVEEFRQAKNIFLINSVRKWMPARLKDQEAGADGRRQEQPEFG
jgi:para-aminobenzoate synthetase/4-amino-4-deoxychorismate lyase